MPRRARIVVPGLAHHITQRGSRRGEVFFCDEDRSIYLDLLHFYAKRYSTELLAYCLMNNHVHHLLVPSNEAGLSMTLRTTHMRYATIVNGRQGWTGHLWQERFYSAPLDDDYFWIALRYVERNPVKAGIVKRASDYKWSSAKAHCFGASDRNLTQDQQWLNLLRQRPNWSAWLENEDSSESISRLRENTRKELPCGSISFIKSLESKLARVILPAPRGRPRKMEK